MEIKGKNDFILNVLLFGKKIYEFLPKGGFFTFSLSPALAAGKAPVITSTGDSPTSIMRLKRFAGVIGVSAGTAVQAVKAKNYGAARELRRKAEGYF